jgi:GNAT superfamily N-acetyltransferase
MSDEKLVTLTESTMGRVQMQCGHSPAYRRGFEAKIEWTRARIREGMRYTIMQVKGHTAGMMETIPAEFAWRGIEAQGYLFIHCFWVIGQNRGHGYGKKLLSACLEEARGTNGVAVMVSKAHWLPTPKIFLKNGFTLADQAAPSFDLLVKQLNPEAPLPRFKGSASMIPPGLTLYHSDQCPYTQNVPDIVNRVGEMVKVPVNIIHLDNAREAQAAPGFYGTLGYFFNGELLTFHPTGTEKLLELLRPRLAGHPA